MAVLLTGSGLALTQGAGRTPFHTELPPEPRFPGVLVEWQFDPLLVILLLAATALYLAAVHRVLRKGSHKPPPSWRTLSFLSGLGLVYLALQSPIDTYSTALFSVHMVQHLLLIMLAAPLILLGMPVTLAFRASSPWFRRRLLRGTLNSRPVLFLTHPIVTWASLTIVLWVSHFSALPNAALESEFWHDFQHFLFMSAALLFWLPVVNLDPVHWRLSHPWRALYLFLAMPQESFVGVLIANSSRALYSNYENTARSWGPSVLSDQQLAGGLMWVAGDIILLISILVIFILWWRHEEAQSARIDAAITGREAARRQAHLGSGA